MQSFTRTALRQPAVGRSRPTVPLGGRDLKCGLALPTRPAPKLTTLPSAASDAQPAESHSQTPTVPTTPQGFRAQLAKAGRLMVAPLASVTLPSGPGWGWGDLYDALSKGIEIYLLLLTVRVLLTWFQNINWRGEPFRTLRAFTDPALNACRGIIPAIGGIDLSPMLLFFGLQFAARQLKIMAINA